MTPFDFSKVLTTGAHGMIGSYVNFGLRPEHETLDILNREAVMHYVEEHQPHTIIHLAGATDMVRSETEPTYAYELNVQGTHNVARAARRVGATMVYASTSRVFRGDKSEVYTEADVPDPKTHYGMTKYLGELITTTVPKHIIARTAWVFGGNPENDNKFYGKILKQLQSGTSDIVALDDVRGSPTYGRDFVATIKNLLERDEYGIFHVANAGVATRYELASTIVTHMKLDVTVHAVDRSHFSSGASLPANESISSERSMLRPWKEALDEYLNDEWPKSI